MCTIYSVKSNNFILCPNKETGNVTSDAFIVTTFKVIPQKRSYWTIFCKLSLNVPYQCLFRKKTIREIGHLACLGEICAKVTPFMPVLALIMRVI